MKTSILVALSLSLAAFVVTPSIAGPQQEKMKTCNADAKTKALKGDERKMFMKECLSNKPAGAPVAAAPAASAAPTQQSKMKTCNTDAKAKNLAGDERKKFMKECLSA